MTKYLNARSPSARALRASIAALRLEALEMTSPSRQRRAAVAELARAAAQASAALQEVLGVDPGTAIAATEALAGLAAGLEPFSGATDHLAYPPSALRLLAAHRKNGSLVLPPDAALLALSEPTESTLSRATAAQFGLAAQSAVSGGLPLSFIAAQAWRIDCAGMASYFLPTEEIDRAASRNAIAGIVVRQRTRPDEVWMLAYYVLTQPVALGRNVVISVVSTTGRQVLAGVAEVGDTCTPFLLRAVRGPGALAIEVEGRYERGTVRLDRIRADARRTAALVPEPAEHGELQGTAQYR